MKKLTMLWILLFMLMSGYSQSESNSQSLSNTVDKFCIIKLSPIPFRSTLSVNIEYDINLDSTSIKQLKNTPTRVNQLDVLNYMTSIGWTFINGSAYFNTFEYYYLYFKKSFPKSN